MLREARDPVIACGNGALRLEEIEIEEVDSADAKDVVGRSVRSRLV
jgi:hypothetical protein